MQLELNDQQKMIQKMVREFAEKEIAPVAAELEKRKNTQQRSLKKWRNKGFLEQ